MPLPSGCSVDDDVCCPSLWDIANFLLNTVWDGIAPTKGLSDCLGPQGCAGLTRYVTMGNGDDGVADSLTVAFQGAALSPASFDKAGQNTGITLVRGAFDVRLRESGWPMVHLEDGSIKPPDPDVQMSVSRHAYSHGERMFRTLRSLAAHRTLWISGGQRPAMVNLSNLDTLDPAGGTVGFRATVTCDLPWGIGGI